MVDHYSLIQKLTAGMAAADQSRRINDFAVELGWRPSDRLELPSSADFSTAHLIVEHGLDHTALISFLRHPNHFNDLNSSQQKALVGSSYNSLVDWHINIDYEGVSFVYNRYRPPEFHIVREPLSRTNVSALRSADFERISSTHPTPDVPTLDRAVIRTISLWKRQIGGELTGISNTSLSALFNALIFLRAVEDHSRRRGKLPGDEALLSDFVEVRAIGPLNLQTIVSTGLRRLDIREIPEGLIDFDALNAFHPLDPALVQELISDFYRNRFARYYEYDFSLMSKHALSRIYEHYVSVLRLSEDRQISLLPKMADEVFDRSFGSVYTPEFVARFFARYVRNRLPLRTFQRLLVVDPTCGSGIFLRAILELQNEALLELRTTESIRTAFEKVIGIDIDPNACHAARLSLSLLSLVLIDELPRELKIHNQDALSYYLEREDFRDLVDVVIANPPYVKIEAQNDDMKSRLSKVLGNAATGRPDLYLAVLKIGLDLLKPGGYGLFVLPETFLKSNSAIALRRCVAQQAWIDCVVDLTAVRVFEDVGVYNILLIFQKKGIGLEPAAAKIVRCQGRVAQALQDVLDDRVVESGFYSIHEASQEAFTNDEWSLAPASAAIVLKKYGELAELRAECQLRQGMNTGADDVFVVPTEAIPAGEEAVFVPLLTDREMEVYTVPGSVRNCVFYPYRGEELLDENKLRNEYPKTWNYLKAHRERLQNRSGVRRGTLVWWKPERPRNPSNMMCPKIVTPHVVMTPRFAIDREGHYAISRAPIILSRATGAAHRDHLFYLLGILNSTACFWHIAQRSHVYERGYLRLELSRLGGTRIPSFASADRSAVRKLVRLVEGRILASGEKAFGLERTIDDLVSNLYGLDAKERQVVGLES